MTRLDERRCLRRRVTTTASFPRATLVGAFASRYLLMRFPVFPATDFGIPPGRVARASHIWNRPTGASRSVPVGASFAARRGVMAVRDAAVAPGPLDGGSATMGGTFPDDPPRPTPLMVPETEPDWSPPEMERYLHVVAMERHTAHAVRRHDLLDRLHQHCDGVGKPNPLLLLGPPGSGKSTALATLMSEIEGGPAARRRRDSASLGGAREGAGADTPGISAVDAAVDSAVAVGETKPFVLAHTFGLLGHSDDLRRALLRMCAELKTRFNIYVDLPSQLDDVGAAFPRFLAHAALFGKVVVVLDGLDKAECHDVTPEDWLPAALPLAARVIVASAGCRAVSALKETSGQLLDVLPMAPLDASERARVIDAALEGVGGGPVPASAMLGDLLVAEDAGSPLFLAMAAEEIKCRARAADGDTYTAVKEANGFPGTTVDLLSCVFDRLERRFGTTLVAEAMTLVACSRSGLTDAEMLALLRGAPALANLPASEWEALQAELEPHCWPIERLVPIALNLFGVFHQTFRTAVFRRFADAAAERRLQHLRVAAAFAEDTAPPTHRGVREVVWGCREGHDWHALRALLTDPHVHAHLWNQDTQVDLATHWDALLEGEQKLANARNAKLVPGPNGALVPPEPRPPRRCTDVVAEFVRVANVTPTSSDGILTPDVTKELLADFLAWSGHLGEAATVLRALAAEKGDQADIAAVSVNYKLGRALGRQRIHLECEEALRRALAAEQMLVGAETPMVAEIVTELCKVKMDTGEAEQAGQLAAHAVSVWEAAEAAGYEEADVATLVEALTRLAEVCEVLDRAAAAETAYERALERLEYMLGPDHPEVAEHLGKMGRAYAAHGEWEKAEFCYCRALAFAHRFSGPVSLHISHFYNVLAELYRARGDVSQAQALYQRAVQVIESVLGANHPETATYLNNLGETLRARGRFEDAEPMYVRALAIDESTQGMSHPIVAIRLNNLAELFRDMGRLEDAEPLYQRALAVDIAALGPNHPNVATYLNNLAGLYKAREMWDKAAEHYARAIAIDERALGPDHPDVAIYLNNLAGLYKAQGKLREAEPLYLRALRINEEALGGDHGDMAIYFNNVALLYKAQGKLGEARSYYQRAVDIGEKTLGAEHPQVAARLSNLGALLVDMEEFSGAEAAFARARAIRADALGKDHEDTQNATEWLRHVAERRAAAVERLSHRNLALDVPAVDDEFAGAAANIATMPLSPLAAAAVPDPESKVEEMHASLPALPPPIDGGTPATPPAAPPAPPSAETKTDRPRGAAAAAPEPPQSAARDGTGDTTPRAAETISRQLHASREAVEAAISSVDAILDRYVPAPAPADARSPFASAAADPSPPAIFARRPSPAASTRTSFREAWDALGDAEGSSDTERRARASSDGWDQEVDAAPGLAQSALDAFLSAHVEYLGNRQYRCVLDGKVLSKFSIMRVHVARKFAGLVHQWAQDQESAAVRAPPESSGVAPRAEGSPGTPAGAEAEAEAEASEAAGEPPPAPEPDLARGASGGDADAASASGLREPPVTGAPEHGRALKRVEELEEEIARLKLEKAGKERPPGRAPAGRAAEAGSIPVATPVARGLPASGPTPAAFYPYGAQGYGAYPHLGVATPHGEGGYAGGYLGSTGSLLPWYGSGAAEAAAAALVSAARYRQSRASSSDFSLGRTPSRGGSPGDTVERGLDFSDMLARERGPNPFQAFRAPESFDALTPKGAASRGASPTRAPRANPRPAAGPDPPPFLSATGSPSPSPSPPPRGPSGSSDTRELGELLGLGEAGGEDVLGMFLAARSQQVARRKFLCEIDGKVFSTMNLMRAHFERRYRADAEAWWSRHRRADASS